MDRSRAVERYGARALAAVAALYACVACGGGAAPAGRSATADVSVGRTTTPRPGTRCAPAPAAAGPAPRPISALAPLWHAPLLQPALDVGAGWLVARSAPGSTDHVFVRAADGHVAGPLPSLACGRFDGAAGALLVGARDGYTTYDVPSGRALARVSSIDCASGPSRVAGDRRGVMASDWLELRAMDAVTGRARWTLELAPSRQAASTIGWPPWIDGGGRLFVWTARTLEALEPSTGCRLWSSDSIPRGAALLAADDRHLVVSVPRADAFDREGQRVPRCSLGIHDAATGTALRSIELGSDVRGCPAEGRLYGSTIVLWDRRAGSPSGWVAAIDVDGTERWARATVPWIGVADDVLFVSTPEHAIEAIDPTTGAPSWKYLLDVGNDSVERLALVVRDLPGGSGLWVSTPTESVLLGRSASPWPAPTITIVGRVLDGAHPVRGLVVRVGDQTATTDRSGRFRAALSAHGEAVVEAKDEDLTHATWDRRLVYRGPPIPASLRFGLARCSYRALADAHHVMLDGAATPQSADIAVRWERVCEGDQ